MNLILSSTRAVMTFPRDERLALIFLASSRVCPVAPVLAWRSDPAKSTKFSFDCLI